MHHEIEQLRCDLREFRTELFEKLRIHQHRQNEILGALRNLSRLERHSMTTLSDLETDVAENSSAVDSAIALILNIKAKLDEAGTDPAKLAALSASLDSNSERLGAAVAANTPAADPAPPADGEPTA